jgi:chromosomal replication initiation ATPase DnaA
MVELLQVEERILSSDRAPDGAVTICRRFNANSGGMLLQIVQTKGSKASTVTLDQAEYESLFCFCYPHLHYQIDVDKLATSVASAFGVEKALLFKRRSREQRVIRARDAVVYLTLMVDASQSQREIGEVLGLDTSGVSRSYSRALRRLSEDSQWAKVVSDLRGVRKE